VFLENSPTCGWTFGMDADQPTEPALGGDRRRQLAGMLEALRQQADRTSMFGFMTTA